MTVDWLGGPVSRSRAASFRKLIASPTALAVPGAFDGMTALLARKAGFESLYLSGAALSASMALPDLGLLTLDDVWRRAREIVRASDLPLIVDCDTGFGEALNVMRAVRELEEVGAACIQIEDQLFPKKCGHLNDKRLISVGDMCRKIAAARRAADQLVICARTDAAGTTSLDDAIARANRYVEAGADLIFIEALTTPDHFRRVRQEVAAPLLANMTEFGRTPQTSRQQWLDYGFNVVIYPVSAFRVTSRAAQEFYASLASTGDVSAYLPRMMPRSELYDTIQYYDYEVLDASIARTVLDHH
ncbi:methylisocitrate lyase [Microvirga antarctica]|uniref:methylisocitrate lyase n=1 Tax=Microvirga antarctica TaxID=2819233 RepID=UPI001B303521|nr:methylisocitrate lyase [Microvirga antarctica]